MELYGGVSGRGLVPLSCSIGSFLFVGWFNLDKIDDFSNIGKLERLGDSYNMSEMDAFPLAVGQFTQSGMTDIRQPRELAQGHMTRLRQLRNTNDHFLRHLYHH